MATKNKKSTKVVAPRNRTHTFAKEAKVEPVKETIKGTVYFALKKIKSGSTEQVLEAALKNGLADYTGQDARTQVLVMLQRLRQEGVAKVSKPSDNDDVAVAKAKTIVKKAQSKKSGSKTKLKVVSSSKPAAESDAASL